jgi:hypothetical protein
MEVTPSGFSRQPMRASGSVEKGAWTTGQVDVVGDGTGSTSRRVAPSSLNAPAAEARATAAPEVSTSPSTQSRKTPLIAVALLAACALVAGTWMITRRLSPSSESIAATPTSQGEQQAVGAIEAPSKNTEQIQPNSAPSSAQPAVIEPAPTVESISSPAVQAAPRPAPARNEPPRRDARDTRGRPIARPGGNAQASSRDTRDQADAESATARAAPIEEPAPREAPAPAAVPEHREEPAVLAATPQPAPAAVAQPAPAVAKQAPVAVTPAAPQRLEATASIADLDVEGSLGTGVVARMLGRVTPIMKSCYGDAAKRANRNDFVALPVELTIDEGGAVRNLTVGRSGLGDLSSCVNGALKRVRSERVPDVGTVQVKFKVAFSQ